MNNHISKKYWTNISRIKKEALKHNDLWSFRTKSVMAYQSARRLNVLEQLCLMIAINVIKKYTSSVTFRKENSGLYAWLFRKKQLSLIEKTIIKTPELTKQQVLAIASQYTSPCFFKKKARKAYLRAKELNIMDKATNHMKIMPHKKIQKMSIIELKNMAKRYSTRTKFIRAQNQVWRRCKELGILEDACSHMKKNASIKYTYESVVLLGKKCKTKAEFRAKYEPAEAALRKKGLLDKFYKEMDFKLADKTSSIGELSTILYLNKLLKIKLKKDPKISWLKQKNGKYFQLDGIDYKSKLAFEYNGDKHLEQPILKRDSYKKRICKKMGFTLIVIKEYNFTNRKNKPFEIEKAVKDECRRLSLTIKNPNAKVLIIATHHYFSMNQIKETISKYKNLKDFRENNIKMNRYLENNGLTILLDGLYKVYKPIPKEIVLKTAKKYKYLKDFVKEHRNFYKQAVKYKYIEELNLIKSTGGIKSKYYKGVTRPNNSN